MWQILEYVSFICLALACIASVAVSLACLTFAVRTFLGRNQ